MKTNTKQDILDLLKAKSAMRPVALSKTLNISPQALHRHLAKLLESGEIIKLGKAPKVLYKLGSTKADIDLNKLKTNEYSFIEKNFSELSSSGELVYGIEAFKQWLLRTNQVKAYKSLAKAYIDQRENANQYMDKNGFINLLPKVEDTLKACVLNKVICQDFYSLPQFGKTILGNLLTAAKSGQDKKSLNRIAKIFEPCLRKFINQNKIDALAWAPHSIPRNLMFLNELKKTITIDLPEIKTTKVFKGSIPIAQKSLSNLKDRIHNAKETIYILESNQQKYNNVLIIDDALGSGATINEIAIKIKKQFQTINVYGIAIVGSYKGFDVISVI